MITFILLGLLFVVFGLLFIFAPYAVVKISEVCNRMVFTDAKTLAHKNWSGAILLIAGILMFYLGFRIY